MPLDADIDPLVITNRWLAGFNAALATGEADAIAALFRADSHWRDVVGLSWDFATTSGRDAVAARLAEANAVAGGRDFAVAPERLAPRVLERAGAQVVEAILSFETKAGRGEGLVRLRLDDMGEGGTPLAWTLMTALDHIHGHDPETLRKAAQEPAIVTVGGRGDWAEGRARARAYADHDPAVLVVGGGHAGITAAAYLGAFGVDTLVIDREVRIGDNWRLRYHGLKLHNQPPSNHMPFLPFPPTWPDYTPKDKIANWLETYVDVFDISFWTETELAGATYDDDAGHWTAEVRLADGTVRIMRPRHIILATGVSATPKTPEIPTLGEFKGTVRHTSEFSDPGSAWAARDVLVLGVGTSAHDVSQDLEAGGARVTMVQRSASMVVNIEPSAQMYDGVFFEDGPSIEDKDMIALSMPLEVLKVAQRILTDEVREIDKPLLDGLAARGFKLHSGPDGCGWPLLFRTRGGGYYFNAGGSELIVEGRVGLIQWDDIETFTANGVSMRDGTERPADLVILATGYHGFEPAVENLFGKAVLDRVGQIWNFDANQELASMWMATGQPGLWLTAGAFSQCRIYSKYMALQIKARELGLV